LSTIRNANRIAVVDNGKVREIGNHDELMMKPHGYYKRLFELQNLDANSDGSVTDLGFTRSAPDEKLDDDDNDEIESKAFDLNVIADKGSLVRQAWLIGSEDAICKHL